MKTCENCRFSAPQKWTRLTSAGWFVDEFKTSTELYCHRFPRGGFVSKTHWCGEWVAKSD